MKLQNIKNKKWFDKHGKNSSFFRAGFSLVETLIYIVIFTMFITAVVSFESSMTASRMHNQKVLEVNDQGAKAMKIITQAIRNANQVNSPTIGNTDLNLSLATSLPTTNPTVFGENGGVLYITEGTNDPIALTNNKIVISDLLFSNYSRPDTSDIIKISFKVTSNSASTSPGGVYSFTFNGSANLRK
jgi:Tfp pilus assembly protein PilW